MTVTVGVEARCIRTWKRVKEDGAVVDVKRIYHTSAESNQRPHLADSGKQNMIPLCHLALYCYCPFKQYMTSSVMDCIGTSIDQKTTHCVHVKSTGQWTESVCR